MTSIGLRAVTLFYTNSTFAFGVTLMFIAVNEFGDAWNGIGWGWDNTIRFLSPATAVRKLQEAGEDLDRITIIEDPFEVRTHAHSA